MIMKELLKNKTGQFRIISFLEGTSFLLLLFIAMPLKYYFNSPATTAVLGPVHGVLFIAFIFYAFLIAEDHHWKFTKITWKILLASVVPFGTFYIDKKYLREIR